MVQDLEKGEEGEREKKKKEKGVEKKKEKDKRTRQKIAGKKVRILDD